MIQNIKSNKGFFFLIKKKSITRNSNKVTNELSLMSNLHAKIVKLEE